MPRAPGIAAGPVPGTGAPALPAGSAPAGDASRPVVRVAAGVLVDGEGRVLIARRPEGSHAGGYWEFPGGKIGPGETGPAGLARELAEELGIVVTSAEPLITYRHDYPDRVIELEVFLVPGWQGHPEGLEGQPLQWRPPGELAGAGLLPADLPIVEALAKVMDLRLPR